MLSSPLSCSAPPNLQTLALLLPTRQSHRREREGRAGRDGAWGAPTQLPKGRGPHWSLLMRSCGAGRDGVTLPAQRTTFQSLGCKVVCGWELFRQPQPSVLEKKPLNQSGSSGSPTLTQMASDWAMHTQGGGGDWRSLRGTGRSQHGRGQHRHPCLALAHRPCPLALYSPVPVVPCRFAVLKVGHPLLKRPRSFQICLLPPLFLPVSQGPKRGGAGGRGPHVPTTEPIAPGAVCRHRNQDRLRRQGCAAAVLRGV